MALPFKTQMAFWGAAVFGLFGFIWLFKPVLMPFILGIAIAYLLNPLIKCFAERGIKRTAATLVILAFFFLSVILLLILILPVMIKEGQEFIAAVPDYINRIMVLIEPYRVQIYALIGEGSAEEMKVFIKDNLSKIMSVSGGIAGGLAAGGQAVIGFVTTAVLTPLVAFFMMKEWPAITGWVEDLIPRQYETVIQSLLKQIDQKLSGFVRGQITVAFILAVLYAAALSIADLNYGFLIGVMAGLLSIIPLVGSTLGLFVSMGVAWFQAGTMEYVAIIGAIFIAGQVIEGNILTPKLLGDSVGLHPLWILFALMAGGSLFGIVGMLLAVPVAAVTGVLASFALLQYKKSPLYKKPVKKTIKDKSKDQVNS